MVAGSVESKGYLRSTGKEKQIGVIGREPEIFTKYPEI
jgi:hypothetical protein